VQQFVLDLGKWRFLTDPISHACWAGIAGYFIGLAVQRPRPRRSFASGPAPFASAVMTFGHLTGRHGTEPAWCAQCNEVFWPAYRSRATCSERCRKAAYRARSCPRFSLEIGTPGCPVLMHSAR
jgi:hypothetical protein